MRGIVNRPDDPGDSSRVSRADGDLTLPGGIARNLCHMQILADPCRRGGIRLLCDDGVAPISKVDYLGGGRFALRDRKRFYD